jgi:hypothetical protein
MKLPPEIVDSDLYIIGHDADGEPEAFVVAKFPYTGCPVCQTAHALFLVNDRGYLCLLCAATKRGETGVLT